MEYVPGLVGGAIGGALGYAGVGWLARQGFYAPVLPGALAGLGCGLLSRLPSSGRGIACAALAFVAGAFGEKDHFLPQWKPSDRSFLDFVAHLNPTYQPTLTLFLLGLGVFLGFWWGREGTMPAWMARPKSAGREV